MTIANSLGRLKLLFLGSDEFSLPTLRTLIKASQHNIHVVTKPATLIDFWAKQQNLNVKHWPVERKQYDLGLVISFGHMIDEDTIKLCREGIFNVHPSLLPRWRGSTPIERAIQHGDKETGVTLMKIKPHKFDVGEILMQKKVDIKDRETRKELLVRLAAVASDMTEEFLSDPKHYIDRAAPQQEEGKTFARKLTPQCGRLDFHLCDSDEIDRKVRAFSFTIDTYTNWIDGRRLSLMDSLDPNIINNLQLDALVRKTDPIFSNYSDEDFLPGFVYFHKIRKILCVKCANQTWAAFRHVSLQSKRIMTAAEFYNGYVNRRSKGEAFILKTL